MTPNPPRLCPFQPQSPPSALVGGNPMPSGTICSSRCAIFVTLSGPDGKPVGGQCALVSAGLALLNLDSTARNLLALAIEQNPHAQNAPTGPAADPN